MKHYNPSISEDANRIFNSKQGDFIGDEVNGIIANVEVKPRCNIVKSGFVLNGTSNTIYTTPSDKDFYLVAAELTMSKDATATSGTSRITATVEGATVYILSVRGLGTTAQSEVVSISFPNPIKIDRNTAINVTNSAAVANVIAEGNIFGYTRETTKGV